MFQSHKCEVIRSLNMYYFLCVLHFLSNFRFLPQIRILFQIRDVRDILDILIFSTVVNIICLGLVKSLKKQSSSLLFLTRNYMPSCFDVRNLEVTKVFSPHFSNTDKKKGVKIIILKTNCEVSGFP